MKLAETDILKLLPEHISGDGQFSAAGAALNPHLRILSRSIPNLLIYARLGGQAVESFLPPLRRLTDARPGLSPLSMEALEALAWQFHVDFREVAKTDAQLASMVLSSIAWHRIKGTPQGMKKALALFGFAGIEIEEPAPDMHWATYQLGLPEITEFSDLAKICAIAREMQPARCRLWRVYNEAWDQRPGIWDYDNTARYGWDNFWWDLYSGVEIPEIPGESGGLIASFGSLRRIQSDAWQKNTASAAFGRLETIASIIPYPDHFIWDVAHWDDIFVRNHGFVIGEVISLQAGSIQFTSGFWPGDEWSGKPWGSGFKYDRHLPEFEIFWHSQPKSQLVYDDASDKLVNWHGYDDINSCHDLPFAQISEASPNWDAFDWDTDKREAKIIPIFEQFSENLPLSADKLNPVFNTGALVSYDLSAMSSNGSLAAKPKISGTSEFTSGAGQLEWQSDIWNDNLWDERAWGKAKGVAPLRKPGAFVVSEGEFY